MKHRKFCWGISSTLRTGGLILATLGLYLVFPSVHGIQYSDGTTGFSYPLRLTTARTTRNTTSQRYPTYYISFTFPEAAEEPLDQLVISLDEGRRDPTFSYRLEATQAIVHTPAGDRTLPIGTMTQASMTKALTIQFDPPIPPGNPITLVLKPEQNPRFEGVYLFGITAFPVGQNVEPTFVGYARLSFYEPSGTIWP